MLQRVADAVKEVLCDALLESEPTLADKRDENLGVTDPELLRDAARLSAGDAECTVLRDIPRERAADTDADEL